MTPRQATDGSGSWFVPVVMTARNYEGPVETCFMFEYKNPAAMLATGTHTTHSD